MIAGIVVDVGNSRIKWGRCESHRVAEMASLSPDPTAWQRQWQAWRMILGVWAISGSHPERIIQLVAWLRSQGQQTLVFDHATRLDLEVRVEHPQQVGMDRLFNALAVKQRNRGKAAVMVDAGSAVTVDYVDAVGAFRGGAIVPGLRLMAQSLHDYTAKLPVVEISAAQEPPGKSTVAAIAAGVFHAVVGGINALTDVYQEQTEGPLSLFVTGGDAALLAPRLKHKPIVWPEMTLEGIRAHVDGMV